MQDVIDTLRAAIVDHQAASRAEAEAPHHRTILCVADCPAVLRNARHA